MKEFIELIKKLWTNKRTRALTILLLYFVFFFFVFTFLGNSNSHRNIETDPLQYLKNKEVYKMEFIGNNNFIVEDDKIYYNDVIYNIDEKPEELLNYDLSIFTSNNLYNLLKKSTLESTNYVEKSNTYLINSDEFEKLVLVSSANDYTIRIITYENNLNEITIDLQESLGYKIKIYLRS